MYSIEISIAVQPAVKKFIASKFCVEPFVVTTSNYFGSYLHNCLIKLKCQPSYTYEDLKPEVYSDSLRLLLTEDMYRRYGWFIHPRKQYFFNQMVLDIMHEQFVFFMDVHTNDLGRRQYNSYLNFRESLGLTEDELTLKTMEKRWERHKRSLTA